VAAFLARFRRSSLFTTTDLLGTRLVDTRCEELPDFTKFAYNIHRMKIEIYCDESRPERLTSKQSREGLVLIGGLWLPAQVREQSKTLIAEARAAYNTMGEAKWNRVCRGRLGFYLRLVEIFFAVEARFRCVAIESADVDLDRYHQSDQELGFYKFYYQLLHHWIRDFNEYWAFLDFKKNHSRDRLHVLGRVLSRAHPNAKIACVQAVPSSESALIQMTDVLIGAAGYALERRETSEAKVAVVHEIERRLGRTIRATGPYEQKFNIFRMKLQGGW